MTKVMRRIGRLVGGDNVHYQNAILPAYHLRLGGDAFQDNAYFLASAQAEAQRLQTAFGLTKDTRILDVGCGVGRLPIGMLTTLGPASYYRGIDVSRRSIEWCRRHLTRNHQGFQFIHVDVTNPRYNPHGQSTAAAFSLPLEDGDFEIIYLYSVFSHMVAEDMSAYLREFGRILCSTGALFLTAFVEDDVPNMSINPLNYQRSWEGELHCVRYERRFFETLLAQHGFGIDHFVYGQETDGQSAFYITRR